MGDDIAFVGMIPEPAHVCNQLALVSHQRVSEGNAPARAIAGLGIALQPLPAAVVARLDIPRHLGQPAMQARLVRGDHKLTVDATDGCALGDHQSRQIVGKMASGRCRVKHIAEDGQRFLDERRKVHNGWHGGCLRIALRALGDKRGVLHYTVSSLLCKTPVLTQ